jgi:lysophospholipase L1-like esterase
MNTRRVSLLALTLLTLSSAGSALALNYGQQPPKRLYSNGDSTTRAFDANLPFDNLNLSWVNGYYGFWERLFGLPNVKSHNQRITANFGASGRTNWTSAVNGARVDTLDDQAAGTAGRFVTYSTVLLGANDACRDIADLTTPAEFESSFRNGLDALLNNLPKGASVLVAAVPDVSRVYEVGLVKKALGLVDCPAVWAITGNCSSVLSPTSTPADRLFVQRRVQEYNRILQTVTQRKARQHPTKFIAFTDKTYTYQFTQQELSNLDCFHPSWQGQKVLSAVTWNDGPFKTYQLGN